MSKSVNDQPASRYPVDALQYEKPVLLVSVFGSYERQLTQINRLTTIAISIYRNPALTNRERRNRQVLLELLVEACEEYVVEMECGRELYQVIALDARGIDLAHQTLHRVETLSAGGVGCSGWLSQSTG